MSEKLSNISIDGTLKVGNTTPADEVLDVIGNIKASEQFLGKGVILTNNAIPTVAPELAFVGNRQSWRMGIDVANNGGGGDFVPLALDINSGGVRDLIYVARNKEGDNSITDDSGVPTLGFFMTPPFEGVQTMAATVEDKPNRTTFGIRKAAATTDNFMLGFFGSEDEVVDYGVKNTFEHSPFLKVRGDLHVYSSDANNTPSIRLNANPTDQSTNFTIKNYYSGSTGYEFRLHSADGSNNFYKYNANNALSTFNHNVTSSGYLEGAGLAIKSTDINNTPVLRLNANPSDASNDFTIQNYYSGGTAYEFRMFSANGSNMFYKYNPFFDTSTFDHNVVATSFNGVALTTAGSATNFLNEEGNYVSGGSPSGSDRSIQFNNSGVFDGASNISVGTGGNLILNSLSSQPTAPSANKLQIYGRSRAGADWLEFQRPTGREISLQPHIGLNRVATWSPSTGTTIVVNGIPRTAVGTASTPALASTNLSTSIRRWRVTSAATSNSVADERSAATVCWRGNATGLGGFTYTNRISTQLQPALTRAFFGLLSSTAALSTTQDVKALTNAIGFGYIQGTDTNWQVLHNDGSGTCTSIDMGANFPVSSLTNVYTFFVYSAPNGSSIWVRCVEEVSGNVFEQELTTNIPTSTTFLSVRNYMNNGGTASACAYDCSGVYLETDY